MRYPPRRRSTNRGKGRLSKGRWAMERERFQISDFYQRTTTDETAHISERITGVVKKLGLHDQLWETALNQEWETLVGEQVAKHTRPGRLQYKILHIFVTSSPWLSELSRYYQHDILANIQKRFGADKIGKIRLQLDPG